MLENYGWGLPVAASTFAPTIDFGIRFIHYAMFVIFVLWGMFFVYLLIRYKQRDGVRASYGEHGLFWSLVPDGLVLIFEIGLVVFYALPGWSRMKQNFPRPEDSVNLRIVAQQFAWNVQYPGPDGQFGRRDAKFIDSTNVLGVDPEDPAGKDDVILLNEMHLPVDKPVLIQLSSQDVIHSFFVPEFRIKQDATQGLLIPVWFQPNRIGKYEIACAQLCGNGHATMHGGVEVHSASDYDAWLKSAAPSHS